MNEGKPKMIDKFRNLLKRRPKYYEGHDAPLDLKNLIPAEKAYLDYVRNEVIEDVPPSPEGERRHRIPEIRKAMIRGEFMKNLRSGIEQYWKHFQPMLEKTHDKADIDRALKYFIKHLGNFPEDEAIRSRVAFLEKKLDKSQDLSELKRGAMPNTDFTYQEFEGLLGSYYLTLEPLQHGSDQDKSDFTEIIALLDGLADRHSVQRPAAAGMHPRMTTYEWGQPKILSGFSVLDMLGSFTRDFGITGSKDSQDTKDVGRLGVLLRAIVERKSKLAQPEK